MRRGLRLVQPVMDTPEDDVPRLLVSLPPWHRVFLHNLGDAILPRHHAPLRLASKPAAFWPDVFVASYLPWRRFLQSAFCHVALIALVWAVATYWPKRPQIVIEAAKFDPHDVIYYSPAEYLPPLETGNAPAAHARKGDPAYAPQPIISVPPEADNRSQTIVTPPDVKLNHDVPLPNVVSWPKVAPAVPSAAIQPSLANQHAPDLSAQVVAPPPDVSAASRREVDSLQLSVVAPAPLVDATSVRRLGDINIGHMQAVAPAPQLAVPEQRIDPNGRAGLGSTAAVPPPPSVQGGSGSSSGGRLIALGIHPVAPSGPVAPPAGNRRGSFAATPQGRASASGTPETTAGDPAERNGGVEGGKGSGVGAGGRGEIPPGLHVGGAPDPAGRSAIGGNGNGNGTGGTGSQAGAPVQMAKVTPPRVTRRPGVEEVPSSRATDAEKAVFGDRKFYSMSLNVPNLNSSGGSWVIHFAQLHPEAGRPQQDDLVAPSAVAEADPAYPLELMKQNVRGTVTLYAIIRSDGSVSDVRVLNSPDDRLDQYARDAFSHWRFHPATKNGAAVDLEAVVTIPFRPGRLGSSF